MKYTLGKFKATDVFTMAKLLSKIGLGRIADNFGRDNVMSILNANKGKNKDDVAAATGMQMMLQIAEVILANLDKCETEIFKLLSNITGTTPDEMKDLDAEDFAELIVEVIRLPQFKDFFKVASGLLNTAQ